MRHTTMLKKIEKMVAVHGEQKILAGLVSSGVSASTADKIVKGDYKIEHFRRKTVARMSKFFLLMGAE